MLALQRTKILTIDHPDPLASLYSVAQLLLLLWLCLAISSRLRGFRLRLRLHASHQHDHILETFAEMCDSSFRDVTLARLTKACVDHGAVRGQ